MKEFEIEMRGRIVMLETMMMTFMTHAAEHVSEPVQFTKLVMDNTETILGRMLDSASGEDQLCAEYSMVSLQMLNKQIFAYLNKKYGGVLIRPS